MTFTKAAKKTTIDISGIIKKPDLPEGFEEYGI